ncbi:MAG TPA: SRPBCC family protein [Gammaproteobacteria bacterium]|nr:SRPBCC family protein [Gammaproteobacteria bacterium]
MEEYAVSRIFPQARERVYALVADIETYPQFVPGYKSVRVRKHGPDRLRVTQTVSILGLETTFDSSARLEPPHALVVEASPRGFRTMHIEWRFESLGAKGTRIDVRIRYEAAGRWVSRFSRPWVKAFIEMQIRAFRARAEASEPGAFRARR